MPSVKFINLSNEKKEKLTQAIKKELQRVSFDKISIQNIVRDAEISIDIFYVYFEDLDDMIEYMLCDYKKIMFEEVRKSLTNSNGDIFVMFNDLLRFTVEFATSSDTNKYCKNLLSDVKATNKFFLKTPNEQEHKKILDKLRPYINYQMLNIDDYTDFGYMLDILYSLYKSAISEIFANVSSFEKVRRDYNRKLVLLKRGFIKNNKE